MDDYSDKRIGNGLAFSRKGSGLVFRETGNTRDQNTQFCNRIGCNGRLNMSRGTNVSCSDKAKSVRSSSFRSSSGGKETIGSSSRSLASISNPRKPLLEHQKKISSQQESDLSDDSNAQDEPNPPPGKIQQGIHSESQNNRSVGINLVETGGSTVTSTTRFRRNFRQKAVIGNSNVLTSSPVSLSSTSMNQGRRLNASKYGLKNIGCNSKSEVVSSGFSSSESNLSRSKDSIKKRISDGEGSSSFRGKKISGSIQQGHNSSTSSGISISESRGLRSGPANRNSGASSVRTQRSLNGFRSPRMVNRQSGINLSPNDSHTVIPQISQPDMPHDLESPISSRQFSAETPLSRPVSYSRPGSSNMGFRSIRPSSPAEVGNTRSLPNLESIRRHNMGGIAEVLLALDRIEQDEELTYEQLMVLETNLFVTGFNFYDQHRDMRLDIDDMTYEELLALGERMGTVSTALTEEELSECLTTIIYQSESLKDSITNLDRDDDDIKCSICQEEYVDGDKVGRLKCEHRYHVACVHQWLRLKNWCPICKASAASSFSSSSSPTSS